MISGEEIAAASNELGVHEADVQRDYVFGWLLSGLYQSDNPMRRQLVLKGGNSFRKGYFPHARYSNDLDFSTQNALDPEQLGSALNQACAFGSARSGIQFETDDTRIGLKKFADNEMRVYEARVYFRSFNDEGSFTIKVKLDITEQDRIHLPVQSRQLIHAYSDADACQALIQCVKLEELLASKMVALLRRQHSADFYDFIHAVFFQKVLPVRRLEVISTFLKKFPSNPEVAKGSLLALPFQAIRHLWQEYVVCPRPSLFAFDQAEGWFRTAISELFALLTPEAARAAIAGGGSLDILRSSFRDVVMEAGRLQRVIRLVYDGAERRVEPYALVHKQGQDGRVREYFYVWNLSGGSSPPGIRSLFASEVRDLALTDENFTPRFPIELTKWTSGSGVGYFSRPAERASVAVKSSRTLSPKPVRSRSARTAPSWGVTYKVRCPFCGKTFKRDTLDLTLKRHKGVLGMDCPGTIGNIV